MSHDAGFRPRRFVLGQFADADALLGATKQLREKGNTKIDTHTPYPVHGLEAALGLGRPKIPTIVLCGALIGMCTAYAMITYMNVFDFPINIGNRPLHGPPANIPITFELTVLFGGLSAFLGFFGLMKLPEPYHPVFEAESFRRASIDGFFVSIEVPEGTNPAAVAAEVKAHGSIDVQVVEESER
jgi:Alternative complex III, ActD subunit